MNKRKKSLQQMFKIDSPKTTTTTTTRNMLKRNQILQLVDNFLEVIGADFPGHDGIHLLTDGFDL